MLGEKLLYAGRFRAAWQFVNRRVAFFNRDDFFNGNFWEYFAETPNAALVGWIKRRTAVPPELLKRSCVQSSWACVLPSRIKDLQQVPAMLTSETVGQCDTPAAYAAELRHTRISFDCLVGHFGVPSAKKNSAKHKDNRGAQHVTSDRSLVPK